MISRPVLAPPRSSSRGFRAPRAPILRPDQTSTYEGYARNTIRGVWGSEPLAVEVPALIVDEKTAVARAMGCLIELSDVWRRRAGAMRQTTLPRILRRDFAGLPRLIRPVCGSALKLGHGRRYWLYPRRNPHAELTARPPTASQAQKPSA